MPSVNSSYWFLTALSTQLYMLMYVLMFFSALRLRYKTEFKLKAFVVPGGNAGMWITCCLGLFGCVLTLIVGFIPPESINLLSVSNYEILFGSGMLAMVAPVGLFYLYKIKFQLPTVGKKPDLDNKLSIEY